MSNLGKWSPWYNHGHPRNYPAHLTALNADRYNHAHGR